MKGEIQFLLYNLPEDSGKVQVIIKEDTIWCTQKAMAQLFGVGVPAISKHLKGIFDEGELPYNTTVSKMETVVNRGIRGEVNELIDFYNLDAIIAVGYRVNSLKATRFRQWATKILNEYIRKGFALDERITFPRRIYADWSERSPRISTISRTKSKCRTHSQWSSSPPALINSLHSTISRHFQTKGIFPLRRPRKKPKESMTYSTEHKRLILISTRRSGR